MGNASAFNPEGNLLESKNGAAVTSANQAQPDGSGMLGDVIFADYGQPADQEVARVNFARPGKKTTDHSMRMRAASFDLISNSSGPARPQHGRRSVGPYSAIFGNNGPFNF